MLRGVEETPATNERGEALPQAERARRRRELWIAGMVIAAILGVAVFQQRLAGLAPALPIGNSVLFLFLNALNVVLIVLLVYLILRQFVKLVFERRRGILGAHLNWRFVFAFVLLATVPTALLYGISAFFIDSSIDAWFSLQVDRAFEGSQDVAESFYDSAKNDGARFGRLISEEITAGRLLRQDRLAELEQLVHAKQREYNLGVVQVFSASGETLVTAVNPDVPAANFSRPDSAWVKAALAGEAGPRVEEHPSGDVVRAAVPIVSSFDGGEAVGAVIVNYFVPYSLARRVAEIRTALAEYRQLQPHVGDIRAAYLLSLLLFFLVIVLVGVWWGFRLAKGVTGPIAALAEGTAQVARGNLDVVVDTRADDEVGFLVDSFNRMTRDLREARLRLEQQNAEIEQRRLYMETVLRNTGAGVISVDADGRIGTLNPSAQRLLGIPPGQGLVGRPLAEVLARADQRELVRDLADELRPGVRESVRRQKQISVGGEVLTLLVTMTLLRDEDGRDLGSVLVFDDYSQLVRAQRMAAWREVARRIAHEIKNPLTPIQLSAERMRRRFRHRMAGEAEDLRVFDDCVDSITSQVESLKGLVDEFSNFARLPASNPRPDDLNRLVAEVVAGYEGTEGVIFKTDCDPGLPAVDLDRDQLRRVLTNLVDNAIAAVTERRAQDAEAGPGHVELRTVHDAALQTARVEVADDGIGIRGEDRRRVFEPYFSTKRQGTGLGLAIVSRIVADHRGYVRVRENRPRGTRFVVELPLRGAP
jgi:two-component system nitrogen regulation sensor histidine kinase NtrY